MSPAEHGPSPGPPPDRSPSCPSPSTPTGCSSRARRLPRSGRTQILGDPPGQALTRRQRRRCARGQQTSATPSRAHKVNGSPWSKVHHIPWCTRRSRCRAPASRSCPVSSGRRSPDISLTNLASCTPLIRAADTKGMAVAGGARTRACTCRGGASTGERSPVDNEWCGPNQRGPLRRPPRPRSYLTGRRGRRGFTSARRRTACAGVDRPVGRGASRCDRFSPI